MNISQPSKSLKTNQSGLVSIIVTMMLMLVITLITLTFAKITRREQRQALDRQLNTQAFYAAESGVNAAVQELKNGSFNKNECNNASDPGLTGLSLTARNNLTGTGSIIDVATDVAFTCLTINPAPTSLEYQDVDTDQSTVIPVKSTGGNISKINVSWQEKSGNTDFDCGIMESDDKFEPSGSFPSGCRTGILRLDIVPANIPTRSNLATSKTVFLIADTSASTSATTIPYNPSLTSGDKIKVKCNASATPKFCNATINFPSLSSTEFYLRAISIYASSSVTVSAEDSGNNRVSLTGAQTIIDSTGRAGDILRRIQVRRATGSIVPDFALQSTNTICKRLKITTPGGVASVDYGNLPGSVGGAPDQTPCQIP